jgi:hypothetical protein
VNIIVPAFIPPPGFGLLPDWTQIYSAWPTVTTAVLNINLDHADPKVPFETFMDSKYVKDWKTAAPDLVAEAKVKAPGLRVLGYVPTDDATQAVPNAPILSGQPRQSYRTLADIKGYVDHWYRLCPNLDGIFFDEGPAAYRFTGLTLGPPATTIPPGWTVVAEVQQFYVDLYNHVKAKAPLGTHVILNASEFMDEWVMGLPTHPPVADTVELFEGECAKYEHRYTAQPWIGGYPVARILHVIHTCRGYRCLSDRDEMIRMVALAQERGAGNVYVFDGTSSAYNELPTYWTDEVAAVSDTCTAIRGARDQAFDKLLHLMREARPRVVGGGGFPDVHLAWDCFAVWAEMIWRARRLNC